MAAEFLQDLTGISASSYLDQTELTTDTTSLEDVDEIVKRSLRKINEMAHDDNAWDGFPGNEDDGEDLVDGMKLQICDLVGRFQKKFTTGDTTSENVANKDAQIDSDQSNKSCATPNRAVIPQSSDDLLEDITLVINSDACFSSIATSEPHFDVANKEMAHGKMSTDGERLRLASPQDKSDFGAADRELITSASKDVPGSTGIEPEKFAIFKDDHSRSNQNWTTTSLSSDNIVQHHHDVDGSSCGKLLTPAITQEDSLDNSKSAFSISDNSLIEQSFLLSPGLLLETLNDAMKVSSEPSLDSISRHDVVVDGEYHENDSIGMCPLSYDENLTCSLHELQLHQDDNSELIEHGLRGRPPRQKVDKPAVPCRIEPKVNQSNIQPSFLLPQLHSSTWQNSHCMHASAVPVPLQPHLGQVIQRFPVLLHNDANGTSQLYFAEYPQTSQISCAASTFSTRSEISSSQSDTSKNTEATSTTEQTSETTSCATSLVAHRPHFKNETPTMSSQSNFSLEIDGPIHRNTLNQHSQNKTTGDPRAGLRTSNQGFNIGPGFEHPLISQADQQSVSGAMSSSMAQSCGFDLMPFINNGQNVMGHHLYANSNSTVFSGLTYCQPGVQTFVNTQGYIQASQRMQVSQELPQLGNFNSPYQVPSQNGIQYTTDGYNVGRFSCSPGHYHGNEEQFGVFATQSDTNMAVCPENIYFGSNDSHRHAFINSAPAGTSTSSSGAASVGLPNFPVDPRSRRLMMLIQKGSPRKAETPTGSSAVPRQDETPTGSSAISGYPAVFQQIHEQTPASSHHHYSNMIQLSPPAEVKKQELVDQCHRATHGNLPDRATADSHVLEKAQLKPKSVPSHTSSRSSKGPSIPVPVEKSKARVETWLNNNNRFIPDLDSGTFDPSDHSLKVEPSLPQLVGRYRETARTVKATSDKSCEVVGLFDGNRMMVVPQQPSPKQKPKRSTPHSKEPTQKQMTQKKHPIFSEASVMSEYSHSSGHTDSQKFMDTRSGSASEFQNEHSVLNVGMITSVLNPETRIMASVDANLEDKKNRKIQQDQLVQYKKNSSTYQLNENEKADLEIAEKMKLFEQESLEKRQALSGSSHVFSEIGSYFYPDVMKSSGSTSGNNRDCGSKPDNFACSKSKQSSFDASKYITQSDIESLDKKKAQNGKSSFDDYLYLDHRRHYSNEIMSSNPNTSHHSQDIKPLTQISLNDIEFIGLNKPSNQYSSGIDAHCPAPLQPENRQKAPKRRTDDHFTESTPLVWQGDAVGISQRNQNMEMMFTLNHGIVSEEQKSLHLLQHQTLSTISGRTKDQLANKSSGKDLAKNPGGQRLTTFDMQGVVGPPVSEKNLVGKSRNHQAAFVHFQASNIEAKVASCTSAESQIQTSTGPHIMLVNQEIPKDLNSGQSQGRLQDFNITNLPVDVEMSSFESMIDQGLSFNHGLSIETNMCQTALTPVPSAYMSTVQELLPLAPDKRTQAVTVIPRPASSSSPLSTVSSTSHMSQTQFKQPHSVAQTPAYSIVPSGTSQKTGVLCYQSMGGDSDVSMSSDTSLPCGVVQQDNMYPKVQKQQIMGQYHLQQEHLQLVQERPQKNLQIENQQDLQQIHRNRLQQVQHHQLHPEMENQEIQQQIENQQDLQQIHRNRLQQVQHHQLHPEMENQEIQQQIENQQDLQQIQRNRLQQVHHQLHPEMENQEIQQQIENQQDLQQIQRNRLQQVHHQLHPEMENQEIQQQIENQQQKQQQRQSHEQQHPIHNQQQQTEVQDQPQHQQQMNSEQQQKMENQKYKQNIQKQQEQHQLQTQNKQEHQQLIQNQYLKHRQMQNFPLNPQEMQKLLHNQQQIQNQQTMQKQLQHSLEPFANASSLQAFSGFQGIPNQYSADVKPSGFKIRAETQTVATANLANGLFCSQQPANGNDPNRKSSSSSKGNLVLDPQSSSQTSTCTSVQSSTAQSSVCQSSALQSLASNQEIIASQYNINGTHHRQMDAQIHFRQIPKTINHEFGSLVNSPGTRNVENEGMKCFTGSPQNYFLIEDFPFLGDFQNSIPISPPCDPSFSQSKALQSFIMSSQILTQRDRMFEAPDEAQQAERSRDSDLSVYSTSSDVGMLSLQPDSDGETFLHILCEMPKECREKLPSLSSSPGFFGALNLLNNNHETALGIAVKNEDLEIVTYLISHGADVNIFCISSQAGGRGKSSRQVYRDETVQQTALHEAVELGNADIVKVLLTSQNVKVDAKRPDSGLTPLMLALQLHRQSVRKEIILELTRHQASLSLHDTIQGKTPLMYAIQSKDVSLVEQMLHMVGAEKARALVNQSAKKDMTCLHFAAELRLESTLKKRLLRCIIAAGGDPSAKNSEGETPRDWARIEINEVLHNLASLSNS